MIESVLKEIYKLYIEMSPFLFLGLTFSGILHYFLNGDKIAKHIGNDDFLSVLKATLLGIPLPLCSCGVIPTAIHLHRQNASKAATVSFLISTPQTGIDSIIATYGLLGPVFALFRPFAALITGIFGGLITNKLIKKPKKSLNNTPICLLPQKHSIRNSIKYAFVDFLDDISGKLLFGIFIAGLITFFIPDNFFQDKIGNGFLSMAVMILVGVPMYICATGSIPIAASLILKGVSPGAAFVFLMVGPATNVATIYLISKSLGKKITIIYLAVIIFFAFVFGTLLNIIFTKTGINPVYQVQKSSMKNIFYLFFTILFTIAISLSLLRKIKSKLTKKEKVKMDKKTTLFKIVGMSCNHCVKNVKESILMVKGVTDAIVNLSSKTALVKGDFDTNEIISAVKNAGYKAVLQEDNSR